MSFSSYIIEDLSIERQFRVSMTLKACFEASDDTKCLINIDIFKNSLLPKSICDWTAGFSTPSKTISRYRDCLAHLSSTFFYYHTKTNIFYIFIFPDFDLNTWYNNLGINPGSVLSLVNKNKLLNELGIRSYLSTNPCSFTSETFSPANSMGWKNGMVTNYLYSFKLSYKIETYCSYIHTSTYTFVFVFCRL